MPRSLAVYPGRVIRLVTHGGGIGLAEILLVFQWLEGTMGLVLRVIFGVWAGYLVPDVAERGGASVHGRETSKDSPNLFRMMFILGSTWT